MRRISADWIFPVVSPPLRRGILELDSEGRILSVIDTKGNLPEISSLELYNGILIPGFVNAHCHLELSYLKRSFPLHQRLSGFIRNIAHHHRPEVPRIMEAAAEADRAMWMEGIQAVGDISNTNFSFGVKASSPIRYHNFIEVLDLAGSNTETRLNEAGNLLRLAREDFHLKASLVPHAPYTVSALLLKELGQMQGNLLSIHNQETASEDSFMHERSGALADLLLHELGIRMDPAMHGRGGSLETVLPLLRGENNLLLVHNTYSDYGDLTRILKEQGRCRMVLCPNANLYIENNLPDVLLLRGSGIPLCIGTDSLASNNGLSVLDELKTLTAWYPQIGLEEMIRWATIQGAEALEMHHELGSFESGKKPGVILLEGMDLKDLRLNESSKIRRISG